MYWLLGLMPWRPVDNGPQEGDYSAWVAWGKGKVETRKTSQGAQLSLLVVLSSREQTKMNVIIKLSISQYAFIGKICDIIFGFNFEYIITYFFKFIR